MPIIRSISGIRATLNDGLRPDTITKYVASFCNSLPNGAIVVGRDGRPSGQWINDLVRATVSACGRKVYSLGICPTPTVQLVAEKSDAVGGIAITASHNPEMWNGLKFLSQEGVFLNQIENEKFWKIFDEDNNVYSEESSNAQDIEHIDSVQLHIDAITKSDLFNLNSISTYFKQRKFKVVVDAVNASGSLFVPRLLKEFGCNVVELFTDNSGVFPHTPEPITENLTELSNSVIKHKADIGIAVDPDADRLVIIDENGKPIGEEKTIAIAVKSVLSHFDIFKAHYDKSIIVNLSTSGMVDQIANEFDAKVIRSAVGEINVVEKMKESNSVIGGEGSGGVILPHIHYGRDSLVGIALLLLLLKKDNVSVGELSKKLPKLFMRKGKIEYIGDFKKISKMIIEDNSDNKIDNTDGIRLEINETDWVQIRASNTEPILRIIAESHSEVNVNELYNTFEDKLKYYFQNC